MTNQPVGSFSAEMGTPVSRTRIRQSASYSGLLAVLATFGGMGLAMTLSPGYDVRVNALSNLGVSSTDVGTITTAVLFNGGLLCGGVFGLVFAGFLFVTASGLLDRAVSLSLALTVASMALVGVFPQGHQFHYPAAATFYLLITATLSLDAVSLLSRRQIAAGTVVAAAGSGNILTWVAWSRAGQPYSLAIPELIGATIFACWIGLRTLRLSSRLIAPAGPN